MQPNNNSAPNSETPNPVPSNDSGEQKQESPLKKLYYIVSAVLILAVTAGSIYWMFNGNNLATPAKTATVAKAQQPVSKKSPLTGVQLVTTKDYGDKYSTGILPVGDGKYVTDTPKAGYVYVCGNYAQNMRQRQGGAGKRGPWFIGTTQYDINKKIQVKGNVKWQAQFSNIVTGSTRSIVTNDLPDHTTGVFPISPSDPAYAYDRNPNSIKGQSQTYALSSAPVYGSPGCVSGQVGIMLSGAALFSGFDAEGRDAGAWEVQDSCSGHPEKEGMYHYHTLSSCIKDIGVKTVIGFALDGYPITGPKVISGNILTTKDLDECHGLTSQVVLDGKNVTTYHYVMTQDFPYSISCYRASAIPPPGQPAGPAKTP